MRLWHRTRELLRTLFRPNRVSRDLDDELGDWIETLTARQQANGVPEAEARRRALLEFGGVARTKEEAVALVLVDALRLGALGFCLGVAATVAVRPLLGRLLFDVTASDPLAYAVAITALMLSVGLASWLPARRAALAPPMTMLRTDG